MKKVIIRALIVLSAMQVCTSIKEEFIAPITHHLPAMHIVVPQVSKS